MTEDRINIPPGLRIKILVRDGFRCTYCGATPESASLQVDHVIPVCKGGTNDPGNLVAACRECNIGKGGKLLLDILDSDIGVYIKEPHEPLVPTASGDLIADWLPQFKRWWPSIQVLPETMTVESVGEFFDFSPTFICRGRSGCDIGPEVRVLLVEWSKVGRAPAEDQLLIRNAVISGYSVPTMVIMGRPSFFFGALINERYKGTPRGRILDHFLQPSGELECDGWYPDEDKNFSDLRSHVPKRTLTARSWDAEDEEFFGVYSSCDCLED